MLKEKGAIGILETKGFVNLLNSLDAMLKASNVEILEHQKIGAGLISISIYGDIGSVRVAIDAGIEEGKKSGCKDLKATILANPVEEMNKIFLVEKNNEKK